MIVSLIFIEWLHKLHTLPSALHVLTHLIFPQTQRGTYSCCPHSKEEKTETQNG